MLCLLMASGAAEKAAWVLGVVVLLVLGGAAVSRLGGARHGQDLEAKARREADRSFR